MHNVITELNYRYRLGQHADELLDAKEKRPFTEVSNATRERYEQTAEAAVRYLLFTAEAPLVEPIQGNSSFIADFGALGPRDSKARSLRDFDLHTRILKHPCSYLIYSGAFGAIPEPARDYLLRRLSEVLTGQDRSKDFATLYPDDRRAILEILVDPKPGLSEQWKLFLERNPVSQNTTPALSPAHPQRRQ